MKTPTGHLADENETSTRLPLNIVPERPHFQLADSALAFLLERSFLRKQSVTENHTFNPILFLRGLGMIWKTTWVCLASGSEDTITVLARQPEALDDLKGRITVHELSWDLVAVLVWTIVASCVVILLSTSKKSNVKMEKAATQ